MHFFFSDLYSWIYSVKIKLGDWLCFIWVNNLGQSFHWKVQFHTIACQKNFFECIKNNVILIILHEYFDYRCILILETSVQLKCVAATCRVFYNNVVKILISMNDFLQIFFKKILLRLFVFECLESTKYLLFFNKEFANFIFIKGGNVKIKDIEEVSFHSV